MSDKTQQLFIPDRIRAGFQKREGTYTGTLAYVVYYDQKGVLRKEASWESWRDEKIPPAEFANEPTEGFVLNRKVGGHKSHWNYRDAHVRVHDPRGFEFEIGVPNLLFILRECDCSRGKGLEGKFVYAWDRTELVLLPVSSQDYLNSKRFTGLQARKLKGKELVPGASYLTRKQEPLTYLGRFDYFFVVRTGHGRTGRYGDSPEDERGGVLKRYVFWDGAKHVCLKDTRAVAALQSDTPHPDFAALVDAYNRSAHGSRVVRLFLKEVAQKGDSYYGEPWFYEDAPGVFVECRTESHYQDRTKIHYVQHGNRYTLHDGVFTRQAQHSTAYPPGREAPKPHYGYPSWGRTPEPPAGRWVEPTDNRLFAELESGAKIRVTYGTFERGK